MQPDELLAAKRLTKLDLTFQQLLIAGLLALSLVLAFILVRSETKVRTILVPPEIPRTIWVDADQASGEYLEQMGNFLIQMVLNTSGTSADYQGKLLKKYACPSGLGSLDIQIKENAIRLKRDNATTLFQPREFQIDQLNNKVAARGEFGVFVGDKRVSNLAKVYLMTFELENGRICVARLEETNDQDLWGVKRAATDSGSANGTVPAKPNR
jgi:conjugal transfer pilus assembly protein TraE